MKMTVAFYYPLGDECGETIETDHFQKTLDLVYSDPVCSIGELSFPFLTFRCYFTFLLKCPAL